MNPSLQIYVRLPNEAVAVWRPVQAEALSESIYQIIAQPYDPDIEVWEFQPGDRVICKYLKTGEGETILAATGRAPEAGDASDTRL